ncbi:xanthine/uracil permease [Povalibacter uvarum]|uniref:Xanthine/uracil permease n=1 Tax=Povalibacter uvarum TaxID=732238 RepID=A0A841HJI6_9GAMM|nr:hypothetical protein [Povalibacter uvarum]MBB6093197.1 xanthine/uracil permease [Povalibacter uvarum]
MGIGFWLKRLVLSFVVAFAILVAAQLLKGASSNAAISHGLLWGVLTAAVFTGSGYIRYRRNPACMVPAAGRKQGGESDQSSDR